MFHASVASTSESSRPDLPSISWAVLFIVHCCAELRVVRDAQARSSRRPDSLLRRELVRLRVSDAGLAPRAWRRPPRPSPRRGGLEQLGAGEREPAGDRGAGGGARRRSAGGRGAGIEADDDLAWDVRAAGVPGGAAAPAGTAPASAARLVASARALGEKRRGGAMTAIVCRHPAHVCPPMV